jgi:cyclophilin family peptidyl-prolyl cis-trans isomerase
VKPLALLFLLTAAGAQTPPLPPGLYAVFHTAEGEITAKLYEKYTPIAVKNFVALAQGTKTWFDAETRTMVKRPLYDNITFHRVIPGEMIQAGPSCGVRIRDEFLPGLRFDRRGRLAVANTGDPDTGGCGFFITTDAVRRWNDKYTIFGEVVAGQDVVDKIGRSPVRGEKPVDPVKLTSVSIQRVIKP